jgi:hypothetical protein
MFINNAPDYILYIYIYNVYLYFDRAGNNWSWVPIVGSLLGGVLGAVLYLVLIEMHHEKKTDREEIELEKVVVIDADTRAVVNSGFERGTRVELKDRNASDSQGVNSTNHV